jgi:hypothetical protein
MNTFKAEVNKVIFALTSVGLLILLIFPVSLSANHFRYGTMSWSLVDNDTITLKMENGWTANHGEFRLVSDYDHGVSGHIGSIHWDYITITWDNRTSDTDDVDIKITSRTTQYTSALCDSRADQTLDKCKDSTISEMGDNASSKWTPGKIHNYDNGTYVISWSSSSRATVHSDQSANGGTWRNETLVRIGGAYIGNESPVSAVPAIVQVQDNQTFTYQVNATDPNQDNLTYRWGKMQEFFIANGAGNENTFTKPTEMTLSTSGLIEWDVRDNNSGLSTTTDDLWNAVIMVEDRLDNGTAKSYIPIDFFFKVTDPENYPPSFTEFPTGIQTVSVDSTKIFTIKSTDDSGVAPTISVLNPPSDNNSVWDNTTSNAMVNGDNITSFTITFRPDSSLGDTSKVVNIRSTDAVGMTKDQSFGIQVSSVANDDPTAPTLTSPADGDNVTSPVTFRFAGSTDPDGDTVSYILYVCGRSDFVGCSGTSVTAGGNFVPPFNQNFYDNLIPWPSPLYAATSSQQISQDISMIPKWFIMLGVLGLLSVIISLSVKNIKHRRIVFMLFLIIIGTAVSCMKSSDSSSSDNSTSSSDTTTPDTTTPDTTAPTVSSVSTTSDNQSSVAITDNITVTFSEAMDTTYITTNTSDTYCSGTIRVSSSSDNFSTGNCVKMSSSSPASSNSNKTFTLDPYDNLTRITTYLTRVTTGVKDTAGNAMSSQYETPSGFTTDNSSITVSNSSLTSGTTYYWKVVASDPKGGSAQSETWSFTVQ